MKNKITLAVETAVGGGSLSLFENEKLLDEWSGEERIARSERFLPILDEFLSRNNVSKNDLDLIAVSRGPGNFTGARIGLATALALKNGLGIECAGTSVLRAIALSSMSGTPPMRGTVVTAILNDKTQVIREKFTFQPEVFGRAKSQSDATDEQVMSDGAKTQTIEEFVSEIKLISPPTDILLEKRLYERIVEKFESEEAKDFSVRHNLINIGENLSLYVGRTIIRKDASDNLEIIYLTVDVDRR